MSDVGGLVDDAHLVINGLQFEVVSVLFTHGGNEVDDIAVHIGDLDRIGFDVDHGVSEFLYLVLERNHEQGASFGDFVVEIAVVRIGRIVEPGGE